MLAQSANHCPSVTGREWRRNAMQKIESSVKSARDIVLEFTEATERRDFQSPEAI